MATGVHDEPLTAKKKRNGRGHSRAHQMLDYTDLMWRRIQQQRQDEIIEKRIKKLIRYGVLDDVEQRASNEDPEGLSVCARSPETRACWALIDRLVCGGGMQGSDESEQELERELRGRRDPLPDALLDLNVQTRELAEGASHTRNIGLVVFAVV